MSLFALLGSHIRVHVNADLSLTVQRRDGRALWETSKTHLPVICLRGNGAEPHRMPLADGKIRVTDHRDGCYQGHAVYLHDFNGHDILVKLVFALDPDTDELMVQVEQAGGTEIVVDLEYLYRFEKPVSEGGYMVLPHGSGYLIPAECPDALPGAGNPGGFIGGRWALPMFGMVRGDDALCAIVETWWDCEVAPSHMPGEASALSFHWRGSLGRLEYPRRFLLRFDSRMDYVAMAKLYRRYARKQGLLRTLEEKATHTPAIGHDIGAVLYRWPAWNPIDGPTVLNEIQRLREMGFEVKFFFPKWPSAGYTPEQSTATTADANWQALLLEHPVPGGWDSLVEFANAVRRLGCTLQGFVNPRSQRPGAPAFDEARWPRNASGQAVHDLSVHDAVERIQQGLDNLERRGLRLDALYFDGYSAYHPLPEDFSQERRITRRLTYEAQNVCFAETRRRGIMSAGELARFWCIADCDYFFFTDWSSDRLSNTQVQGAPAPVGRPIPLFQLVFHDCYLAGFSGGGYAVYSPGYDWWASRTPRLYELLFASAPAYNWLPEGHVPIGDMDLPSVWNRLAWLKRWSLYHRTVATSEMLSHTFVSGDPTLQQIDFANGVTAMFNMETNEFRVTGSPGFSGAWEAPEGI